jgi:hypothetical protein
MDVVGSDLDAVGAQLPVLEADLTVEDAQFRVSDTQAEWFVHSGVAPYTLSATGMSSATVREMTRFNEPQLGQGLRRRSTMGWPHLQADRCFGTNFIPRLL